MPISILVRPLVLEQDNFVTSMELQPPTLVIVVARWKMVNILFQIPQMVLIAGGMLACPTTLRVIQMAECLLLMQIFLLENSTEEPST